jgi:hypothetical protein
LLGFLERRHPFPGGGGGPFLGVPPPPRKGRRRPSLWRPALTLSNPMGSLCRPPEQPPSPAHDSGILPPPFLRGGGSGPPRTLGMPGMLDETPPREGKAHPTTPGRAYNAQDPSPPWLSQTEPDTDCRSPWLHRRRGPPGWKSPPTEPTGAQCWPDPVCFCCCSLSHANRIQGQGFYTTPA